MYISVDSVKSHQGGALKFEQCASATQSNNAAALQHLKGLAEVFMYQTLVLRVQSFFFEAINAKRRLS